LKRIKEQQLLKETEEISREGKKAETLPEIKEEETEGEKTE
jgi:hypothetical protein